MSETRINMLTSEEIAELAEIRRKMEELQARYDALVAKAHPLGRPGLGVIEQPGSAVPPASSVPPVPASAVPSAPTQPPSQQPSAIPTPAAPAPPSPPAQPFAGMKLSEAVIAVLRAAGQPLPFEVIFKRLQEGGASLPAEKPMLAVRQVLYNQKLFAVEKNRFRLVNG